MFPRRWMTDLQELNVDEDNSNSETNHAHGKDACVSIVKCPVIDTPCKVPDHKTACNTHDHPRKVLRESKAKVPLTKSVELWHPHQCLCAQVLLEDTQKNNRERSESTVEDGQTPRLIQRRSRVSGIALVVSLYDEEQNFLPESSKYVLSGSHVVPTAMDKEQFL